MSESLACIAPQKSKLVFLFICGAVYLSVRGDIVSLNTNVCTRLTKRDICFLVLLQMQEYGQPPAEIMNELLPGIGGGGDLESLFSQMPPMPGFPGMPGAGASGDDAQPPMPIPGLPDLSDPEKMREFQEQMKNFGGGDDKNCLIM